MRCLLLLLLSSSIAIYAEDITCTPIDLGADRTFVSGTDTQSGPQILTADWEGDKPPKTLVRRLISVAANGSVTETVWQPNLTLENLYTADGAVGRTVVKGNGYHGEIIGITNRTIGNFGFPRAFEADLDGTQNWLPKFKQGIQFNEPPMRGLSTSDILTFFSSNLVVGSWNIVRADHSEWADIAIWSRSTTAPVRPWSCWPLFSSKEESEKYKNLKITSSFDEFTLGGSYTDEKGNEVPCVLQSKGGVRSDFPLKVVPLPLEMGTNYQFSSGSVSCAISLDNPTLLGIASLGSDVSTRKLVYWTLAMGDWQAKAYEMKDVVPESISAFGAYIYLVNTKDHRLVATDLKDKVGVLTVPGFTEPSAIALLYNATIMTAKKDGKTHLLLVKQMGWSHP